MDEVEGATGWGSRRGGQRCTGAQSGWGIMGLREEGAGDRLLGSQGHKLSPPLRSGAMTFSSITLLRVGLCLILHSTSKAYKAPECWASWQGHM